MVKNLPSHASLIPGWGTKIPRRLYTVARTLCSQINKYFFKNHRLWSCLGSNPNTVVYLLCALQQSINHSLL